MANKKKESGSSELLMFYGTECVHCHAMFPLIERLEKETGKKVRKIEVWHNAKNAEILREYDQNGSCGGVPFFYNKKSGKSLCGETTYSKFKVWAS
jgi:thiol-disulfide isomerase/thioredoxin